MTGQLLTKLFVFALLQLCFIFCASLPFPVWIQLCITCGICISLLLQSCILSFAFHVSHCGSGSPTYLFSTSCSDSVCFSLWFFFLFFLLSLLSPWWGQPLHGDETDRGWLKWSLIWWENWPQSELFYQEDTPLLSVSLCPSLPAGIFLTLIRHPLFSLTRSLTMSVLPISHLPSPALSSHFSSPPIHSQWSLSICHHRPYCSVMVIFPFRGTLKFAVIS